MLRGKQVKRELPEDGAEESSMFSELSSLLSTMGQQCLCPINFTELIESLNKPEAGVLH
jgi:hypothetical protein